MRAPHKSALLGGPLQLFCSFCECVSQQSWKTQRSLAPAARRFSYSLWARSVRYMYEMPRAIVIKILLARPLVYVRSRICKTQWFITYSRAQGIFNCVLTLNCLGAAGAHGAGAHTKEKRPRSVSACMRWMLNCISRRVVSDRLFNLLKRRPQQAPWVIFPSLGKAVWRADWHRRW